MAEEEGDNQIPVVIDTLNDKEAETRFIEWYEEICTERVNMSEAEEKYKTQIREYEESEQGYKKRINELESSVTDLVKSFDESQREVKMLRVKYEPNKNTEQYTEPYNVVSRERKTLQESEKKYKKRIKVLEDEVKLLRNYVKDFESLHEIRDSKPTVGKPKKGLVVITSSERLQSLERDNAHLKYVNEKIGRERESLIAQVNLLEAKMKSIEQLPKPNVFKPIKRTKDAPFINRKCVPTFLPKLDGRSSGLSMGTQDVHGSSSNSRDAGSRAGLEFGLSYAALYSKRSSYSSDTSSVTSAYHNIYKYML